MGDRCHFNVSVRRQDATRFSEIIAGDGDYKNWDIESEGTPHMVVLESCEVNYGAYNACIEAAGEGLVFSGYTGRGSEYGPAMFCAIDGRFWHVPDLDGMPGVRVHDDGSVERTELLGAQSYWLDNARVLPGTYDAHVVGVREKPGRNGQPMLMLALKLDKSGLTATAAISLVPGSLSRISLAVLKMYYEQWGFDTSQPVDANLVMGRRVAVVISYPAASQAQWALAFLAHPSKLSASELRTEPGPEPKNNDGRPTCFWCVDADGSKTTPTRKAGGGAYDICTKCGR